jgi:hypothetical protein
MSLVPPGKLPRLRSRGLGRAPRRRALLALAIVVVILAGTAGGTAFAYTNIKDQAGHLQAELLGHLIGGQTELEAAKNSLKQANAKHDQALIAEANVHFVKAKTQFMVARQIADTSQLLLHIENLPQVGSYALSRHVAVDGVADVGVAISDAGRELAALEAQLIIKPAVKGQEAKTLLSVLGQMSGSLAKVREDFIRADKAAASVDLQVLPPGQRAGFVKARDSIKAALTAADDFERLIPVILDVLGGNGPRTYLIEQLNPAELRDGGGFMGTYSVLRAENGALKMIRSGSSFDFAPDPRPTIGQYGYITPPGVLREFLLTDKSWSFMDSNLWPDFPSNVQAAKNFLEPKLGMKIDGVIAMDYYTVTGLLSVTGPIAVPGFGITVSAGNFVTEVIQRDMVLGDLSHKALTSALAGPLMERVSTLPADKWPLLIATLNDMASAHHLQAYFNNATVEKEIQRIGWSGIVNPAQSKDFMMEVESNLGGSKANYFLDRHYTVDLTRNGGYLHHIVKVDLVNNSPWALHPNEYYRVFLRLFVKDTSSEGATNLRSPRYPSLGPPAGTRMMQGWLPLIPGIGGENQAVFEYDTVWNGDARGQHQIYWQKQPGADAKVPDKIDVIFHDGAGHTFTVKGDLAQDRVITASPKGVAIGPGLKGQAVLPSLSLG